jgi:hypothetical protein
MSSPGGGNGLFRVSRSANVQASLRRLRGVALRFGWIEAFEQAQRDMETALPTQARWFGEGLYTLPNARVSVRLGALRPLVVLYGVHDLAPVVFVSRYSLMALPGQ